MITARDLMSIIADFALIHSENRPIRRLKINMFNLFKFFT